MGAYIVVAIVFLMIGAFLNQHQTRQERKIGNIVLKIKEGAFGELLLIIEGLDGYRDGLLIMMAVRSALSSIHVLPAYAQLHGLLSDRVGDFIEARTLAFEEWNRAWSRAAAELPPNNVDGILQFCSWSHPENPKLEYVLGEIINQATFEKKIGTLMQIADLAVNFPALRVRAIIEASSCASSVDVVEQLIQKYTRLDSYNDLSRHLRGRLAKLETRSDVLSEIMADNPVDSDAWKIAFAKLKAMENPSLETSDTYGAP